MKRQKKKLLVKVVLMLCLLVSMNAFMSINAKAAGLKWTDLKKRIENMHGPIRFGDLTGTFTVTEPIRIEGNQKLILRGNATFVRGEGYIGPFFEIKNGGSLSLGELTTAEKNKKTVELTGILKFDGNNGNGCFVNVNYGGECCIGEEVEVVNFRSEKQGNVVNNNGRLTIKTVSIKGAQNNHEDFYQNGEMNIVCWHERELADNPPEVDWKLLINKPNSTVIYGDFYVKGRIVFDLSENINVDNYIIKAMGGMDEITFKDYFTKQQSNVFQKGKGFFSIDSMVFDKLGISLSSSVISSDKDEIYNGNPIEAAAPTIPPCNELSNEVKFEYYVDSLVTKPTMSYNGSKTEGGVPINVGEYYVVVKIKEKNRNVWWKRGKCKLEIHKQNGNIEVNKNIISTVENKKAYIVLTQNVGDIPYQVELSNPDVIKVKQINETIVCQAQKCGVCTVTISTKGDRNITPCSKKVTVKVAPEKIKIKSAKSTQKKKMTVQWKTSKTATGYDLQYARDSKFKKKVKTISILRSKAKKGTGNAKNLKRKATYYVRIRAYYQAPNGEKINGPWSSKKKEKIK